MSILGAPAVPPEKEHSDKDKGGETGCAADDASSDGAGGRGGVVSAPVASALGCVGAGAAWCG
jgi:hypothetical protein